MGNKEKGSKAERELYAMFIDSNYRAVRVAGSGTMEDADCDLIAGKKGKKFAIEVKSSKKPVKYISKKQINSFMVFSEIFALKPVIAIRFNRIGWYFLNPKDMEESNKNWVVNMEIINKKGKRFAQFFDENLKKEKHYEKELKKNVDAKDYYDEIRDLDIEK